LDALGKLGINLGLLIANTVNLILMIVLLYLVAYKPILNMLKKRRERIAEGINNARRAEEMVASAETDKQAVLDEARAEAQRIIAEARTRAEENANQIKAGAREEASKIVSQAQTDAAAEKAMLLADMRDQIVALSIAAANHLIGEELDAKRQKELVKDFFTALPAEARRLSGRIEVVTAVPLTAAEQKKYKADLGSEDITFVTDPRILGGVIVRSGGEQIDGSYANHLRQMQASLS
jgi:F-type H+-transporting ATPase subunit b